jgi:methionyl-tRNA formyltransferase
VRIAIIGRTEVLYETTLRLRNLGHEVALIITAKEAPEYTKTSEDFRLLAKNFNVPFISTPRIEEAIDQIRRLPQIDIGISLNYSGVIPNSVTDLFPLGILNAHAGDLPRYRGNACPAWAIINGEDKVGLCIHRMIGGELDSGDIISRDYFPLTIETKITSVSIWMSKQIPILFEDALVRLDQNPKYVIEIQSKDPADALRCYPRKPEDGKIDWSKSSLDILRLVNACNRPYSGAFCDFEGKPLVIWDASMAPKENFLAVPGQVTLIGDGFIEVATGSGKLRLKEVELAGKVHAPNELITSIRKRLT